MIFIWYYIRGTIITEVKMIKSFRNGFTLAEVLITLGIIGVVAAMTMPTLMNSTNGAQYRTAYKKALSVLSQAVVLNVALDDYDLSQATETDATKAIDGTSASLYNMFNNRMNVVKTTASTTWGPTQGEGEAATNMFGNSSNYTLFFNDGITFTFPNNGNACKEDTKLHGTQCYGVIDVNGEKNPNKIVTCDGQTDYTKKGEGDNCTVTNPTDIYPVVMYDQTILPSTEAARAVLYGGK